MDHCPFFLRGRKLSFNPGFTLVELVVALSLIGLMIGIAITTLKPAVQMAKARDARRKSDLQKLKNPLEEYYDDHNKCYPLASVMNCNPGDGLQPYLAQIPCDPLNGQSYFYVRVDCQTYRVYTKLEYTNDPDIAAVGCSKTVGCPSNSAYNYGISSSNTQL